MKRRITSEQLNELTEEQQQKLFYWWKPETGDYCCSIIAGKYRSAGCYIYPCADFTPQISLPLLDISQMIELLQDNGYISYECKPMPIEVEEDGRKEWIDLDFSLMWKPKKWFWRNTKGEEIVVDNDKLVWEFTVYYNSFSGNSLVFTEKDMVDALWKAVKEAL